MFKYTIFTGLMFLTILFGTDWPQLQANAGHTGSTTDTVQAPFKIRWMRTNIGVSQRVQCIIADAKVFVPSIDGSIYAIDTKSGKNLWVTKCGQKPIVNAFVHTAAYDDNKVFAANLDMHIYALNAENGKILWKYKTDGRIRSAPVLADGSVFIGSADGFFYCLDSTSGKLKWKTEIGYPILDTAAYSDQKIFFGAENVKIYALDTKTGKILWKKQLYGQSIRDRWTVAAGGKVFVTPKPFYHEHKHLEESTRLIGRIWQLSWTEQRKEIEEYFAEDPYRRVFYVVDAKSGNEPYITPILYGCAGSQSPHSQAVIDEKENCYVIYRTSEVGGFATWGATTRYGLYLGKMDLKTGDIEQIDKWGKKVPENHDPKKPFPANTRTKAPFISDESFALTKAGKYLHISGSGRYRFMVELSDPIKITGIINTESYSGSGLFPELRAYDEKERVKGVSKNFYGDYTGDGNDFQRPHPVVDNVCYTLISSKIIAVEGAPE